MNKFKIFMLIFSLFLSIISEPLLAVTGFVSVSSGVNVSPSPVVLGKNFSVGFTLREVNGQAKTFQNVAVAILDPSGTFIFDFAMYSNVTVGANGTWSNTATNVINTNRPAGTYKAVIRGKFAGSWFDFNAVGTGVTPKAFPVVATPSAPPAPVVPPIPPVPTLNAPTNGQTNVPQPNVNFSWSSAGATNYRIVISQNSAFSGFVDANGSSSCNATCFTTTTTTPTYTKNMELAGQTYYWKVRANNATGASGWSVVRSFTTAGVAKVTPLPSSYMQNVVQGFGGWNSSFGGYHTGYDIATANNIPNVYAVDNGTVVWNSTSSTKYTTAYTKYFNAFVIVKHDSGFYAYYGHLNSSLSVNSRVNKGAVIGTIRNAYTSSGALNTANNHLHISISTGTNWVTSGWGYQTTVTGLNQFIKPTSYIGL